MLLFRRIRHKLVLGKIILYMWEKNSTLGTKIKHTRDSSHKNYLPREKTHSSFLKKEISSAQNYNSPLGTKNLK